MAVAISHRGPDDHGEYVEASAGIALAHRRLSIIDLSAAGRQPMATQDGSVVLIFNGATRHSTPTTIYGTSGNGKRSVRLARKL